MRRSIVSSFRGRRGGPGGTPPISAPVIVDVQDCAVNGNKANSTALGEGGGIYSDHRALTLVASTLKGNKATTAYDDLFDGPWDFHGQNEGWVFLAAMSLVARPPTRSSSRSVATRRSRASAT